MLPSNARQRRWRWRSGWAGCRSTSKPPRSTTLIWGDRRLGIVTSSIATVYAREVFPDASFLKLGMAYPLPRRLIVDFARQVDTLLIVEELDPFLEEQIRALPDLPPVRVLGKEVFPAVGEFRPELVARCALELGLLDGSAVPFPMASDTCDPGGLGIELPARPPLLCPGCGHRGHLLHPGQLIFPDQAGAATETQRTESRTTGRTSNGAGSTAWWSPATSAATRWARLQPLVAMDTCGCMGASIGQAVGLEKGGIKNKIVAVIGDSTFYHSGITGLVDVITSGAATTIIILDNFTTAMTGGNVNPGTGYTMWTAGASGGTGDVMSRPGDRGCARDRCLRSRQHREGVAADPAVAGTLGADRPGAVRAPRADQELDGIVGGAGQVHGCWACLVTACPAIIRKEKVAVIFPRCAPTARSATGSAPTTPYFALSRRWCRI